MVIGEELLSSQTYWLTTGQIEAFNLLKPYFTISKLIELALLVGKAPVIQFESIDKILKAEEAAISKAHRAGKSHVILESSKNISKANSLQNS